MRRDLQDHKAAVPAIALASRCQRPGGPMPIPGQLAAVIATFNWNWQVGLHYGVIKLPALRTQGRGSGKVQQKSAATVPCAADFLRPWHGADLHKQHLATPLPLNGK